MLGIVLFSTRNAFAQEPNILGTYTGTAITDEFNCGTGAPGGSPTFPGVFTETSTLTITISSQSGASFSGTGTETFPDGDVDSITSSGTVDTSGNVSGSFSTSFMDPDGSSGTGSGTFSGTISNGIFTFIADGQDDTSSDNIFCQFETDGTLTLVSGGGVVVDPAITPSSTLTAPLLLNTQVKTITSNIGTRIGDVMRRTALGIQRTASGFLFNSDPFGLSAGDGNIPKGAWVSYSYADYDNDFASTAFDGHTHSVLAGFDFAPWERTVFGIAVGYENSDVDTTFNRGNQESDGYTIAPISVAS